MLWTGVLGGVPWLVGLPLYSDAVFELDADPDQGDQLGAVELTPPILGGVEELVGHDQAAASSAGALGDSSAEPHGGECRLDRVHLVRRYTQCAA